MLSAVALLELARRKTVGVAGGVAGGDAVGAVGAVGAAGVLAAIGSSSS